MKKTNYKIRRGDCLAILTLLRDRGNVGLRVSQIVEETDYDKNRVYSVLSHLKKHNMVSNYDHGRYRLVSFNN